MSANSNSHQNIPSSSDAEAIFRDKHAEEVRHSIAQSANSRTLVFVLFGTDSETCVPQNCQIELTCRSQFEPLLLH